MYSARRFAPPRYCLVLTRPRTIFRACVRTFVQVSSISLRCLRRRLEYRALPPVVFFPPAVVSADAVAEQGRAVARVFRERLLLAAKLSADGRGEAEHLSSRVAALFLSV